MDHERFRERILALPVWDTHNHLDGSKRLCAQGVWDIANYFWFRRELRGAGYPDEADRMPEARRAEALARAMDVASNTAWCRAVRRTMKDLWDAEIASAAGVLAANEKIRATARRAGWAEEVCKRMNMARLTVSRVSDNGLHEIRDRLYVMSGYRPPEAEAILSTPDQKAAARRAAETIAEDVSALFDEGVRVFRLTPPTGTAVPELKAAGNTPEDVTEYLAHALLATVDKRGGHVQVFLGMVAATRGYRPRTKAHGHHALNDPGRVAAMHDLFDMYCGCTFEILNAAQLSSMDIVNAARIYTNVYPGGLWWFSFRPSVYRENMQYRLEALPASRCTLLASDARCIEWCYCKTMLVKRLLADFLADQLRRGRLDEAIALHVGRQWLHETARRVCLGEESRPATSSR